MKAQSVLGLLVATSSANAASLPCFLSGTRLENTQQILASNWEYATDQLTQAIHALELKKGSLVTRISQYLKNSNDKEVENTLQAVWEDVGKEFPEKMSQLRSKTGTEPSKSTQIAGSHDLHVKDHRFPEHRLRIKATPEDLGIDSVKQYTGYLDVEDEDKHFFYWFFESRNDPKTDPVILWLNGGPGCSSLFGLFFELGPSSINSDLQPELNPYSWNNNASVIFLEQPVNVGFSYSSHDVTNTVAAGKDVYAFLELFFKRFPEYSKFDFHIAGESYAGHYVPAFATEILRHSERSFNLTSVLIGNGITDPLTQSEFYQPMACGEGGEPAVLSPEVCSNMTANFSKCKVLAEACYDSRSDFACVPAGVFCDGTQMGPYEDTGRSIYDIRTMCEGGDLCYGELQYIDAYLNQSYVQAKLGAEVESYQSCNSEINRNFLLTGDMMKPFHLNVAELLDSGIPVLIYAGDKDFICNWLGEHAWTDRLIWSGHEGFVNQTLRDWKIDGKAVGEVKNYEHFTFIRVYDAGHMVPFDQPENSLEMVRRWTAGDYAF